MSRNKFATMLHRNTNKITVVLVYAVVEWVLILLLLLNSGFSYLIIKYAEFFGVERPCPWCTRLDHIFDPQNMERDLVCEAHANQISKLGYCSNHRKLAESQDMCHHCLSSTPDSQELPKRLSFRAIQNQKEKVGENGELSLKCCCCGGVNLEVNVQEMALAAWEMHLDVHTASASEELAQMDDSNENEADVSIGTEIPDIDDNEREDQESIHSYKCTQDRPSTSSPNLDEADDHGPVQVKEQMVEFQCLSSSVQERENILKNQPPFQLEINEIEEDEVPNTPASVDSPNQFHRNLVFLEKRDTGREESWDGSVTSELEGGEGIESLKSALRVERKTLQALYAELEEERSASAEAASQTMAMINRLQEEKAAMQMEAFQYQRMMEEQSEYDQEALQLMNDLMVKRDKEKQELDKELEAHRKKLLHYETKEKLRVFKTSNASTRSGFSSATCSINAEDSDGLSIDLNQEAREEKGYHNTPVDTVMNLEESLADFEEERLSILAELKVLEDKLMLLDDDNERQFEDVEAMEDFHKEKGIHVDEPAYLNGHSNGFLKDHQQRIMAFDAMSHENGDVMPNGVHNSCVSKFETESKKLSIEAEVDHLYERLQGLEADREFMKHCVNSLRKGDKGVELLQEILQHLRNLSNVELHVRNLSHSALKDS